MLLRVLGPVAAIDDGTELALGGPRQRRLLAVLVLGDGRAVSIDSIIDAVWGDGEPPDGAAKTLQSYVSRLRSVIGEAALVTTPAGYGLDTGRCGDIDARSFETEVRRAQQAAPAEAIGLLDSALARWHGRAFGELADEHWCRPAATRLEELRLVAHEERCQAMLDLGRHADLVADLELLTKSHPLRERFQSQLILALYRSGRQADALRSFQRHRDFLAEETGLDPSPELIQLDHKVASADPSLRFMASGRTARGYVLTEVIGQGAFGTVYRAVQPSVGREVAVKVVRPELADDPAYIRRFEGEARVVARLEHPHIVPLYDFWREPGAAYLVFRLIKGGTVDSARAAGGPWSIDRVSRLVHEIGAALATAHSVDVVHRDVKPANLLYDESGHAYLSDFGIALEGLANDSRGDRFSSAGSPLYASPEQVRDGQATARSDQYALAVVAWELLAGRPPFDASRVTELVRAKLAVGVPPLSSRRTDLNDELVGVLQRATSIHPDDRFDDMTTFVAAWDAALRRGSTITTSSGLSRAASSGARSVGATSQVSTVALTGGSVPNPYKGLRAFDEGDASHFFGRAAEIESLAALSAVQRFVTVVGPSGSGKSSLVRAGLVPRLRDDGHLVTVTVPGVDALDEFAQALLRVAVEPSPHLRERLARPAEVPAILRELLAPATTLVVVIDQFEELWTMTDAAQRDRVLAALDAAVNDPAGRVRVVATIRADFYDRPLGHPIAGPLVRHVFAVTPLGSSEIAAAIAAPASSVGVRVQPELMAALVAETASEAAALPLLQFALTELFQQRDGATMSVEVHRRLGGLAGVVQQRAETVMDALGPSLEPAVRQLFGMLVSPGDMGDDTRRRARRSQLGSVPAEVIEAFGNARLLSFDVDPTDRAATVEIAHESLLQHWPRLRQWLEQDRSALKARQALAGAATRWDHDGRLDADLLRGPRLDDVMTTVSDQGDPLTPTETEFVQSSLRRRRATIRLRRGAVAALSVLTVAALVAAIIAASSSSRADRNARRAAANAQTAQDNADTAEANADTAELRAEEAAVNERAAIAARDESAMRRLAADATSLATSRREVSLLLAVEAFRRDPGAASEAALAAALTGQPGITNFLDIGLDGVQAQSAIAAAGATLAVTVDGDELEPAVVVLDAVTLEPVGVTIRTEPVGRLAVRADGSEIATSGTNGTVRRWDARTGTQIGDDLDTAPTIIGAWPIAYLADGTLVVTSFNSMSVYPPGESEPALTVGLSGLAWALSVDETGRSLAVSVVAELGEDNQVWVYDTTSWQAVPVIVGHPEVFYGLAWRDGTVLAIDLPRQGPASLFELAMSGPNRSVELPGAPLDLDVLNDGRALVTFVGSYLVLDDGLTFTSRPTATVGALAELADGRLVSTGNGGLLVIDPAERSAVGVTVRSDGQVLSGDVVGNQDGTVVMVVGPDRLQRYDTETMDPLGPPVVRDEVYENGLFALSPDARRVAVTGLGFTQLLDATSGQALWDSPAPGDFVRPVFSPDGSTIVTADRQGTVFAVGADDGAQRWVRALDRGAVLRLAWSPDGRFVTLWASASADVVVLDATTGAVLRDSEVGSSAVVTPDGERLVVMGPNAALRVVSFVDGSVSVLDGGAGLVDAVISSDGRRLIGQGQRGQLRIIDLTTGDQIGPGLTVAPDFTTEISWAVAGSKVLIGGPGREIVAYELDAGRRAEIACDVAGRNLTAGEWDRYLGDIGPYRSTCPDNDRP